MDLQGRSCSVQEQILQLKIVIKRDEFVWKGVWVHYRVQEDIFRQCVYTQETFFTAS